MRLRLLISALLLALASPLGHAGSFTESFTTTLLRDPVETTAHWDTAAGELRLPPYTPTFRGSYDTPYLAFGVAVAGVHAVIADGLSGLQFVNFSDPSTPAFAGSFDTPDDARGVTVRGNLAFVADGGSGLQIVDITNPAAPALVGSCDTPGSARGVAVAGNYAYIADGASGLQVVDISNPALPVLVGSYDTPDLAGGVAVSSGLAFVADYATGLLALDVTNPAAPSLVGTHDTPGYAEAVSLVGSLAYVADNWMGLRIVDVANPASPTLVGTYDTPGIAYGVTASGSLAFVADGVGGLQVLDVSSPASPELVTGLETPGDYAFGVAISGTLALVADGSSGLQLLGISYPVLPVPVGALGPPSTPYDVVVVGNLAYLADPNAGLVIVDISNPASPTPVGTYDTPGFPYGVTVVGNLAYVADYNFGLQIVNVANPASPAFVGSWDTPGFALGVTVAGSLAYVADGASGLSIIDVSNPTAPSLAGSYATPGTAYNVALDGNLAFVASHFGGLEIVDVSNPTLPTFVGNLPGGLAFDVALQGNLAFVADHNSGLLLVNVDTPAMPVLVGSFDTPGLAFGVAVNGSRVLVGDHDSGLSIVDVSSVSAPTLLGRYDTPGTSYGVAFAGDLAVVADYAGGLHLVRMLEQTVDPTLNRGQSLTVNGGGAPVLRARIASTQTAGVAWELSVNGGSSFESVIPGAGWSPFASPGADLRWRSTLTWSPANPNPTVSDVTIDWLTEHGRISSITDVPDDQGGWVRIRLTRSGLDFADVLTTPVTGYQVYQRVDAATAALVRAQAATVDMSGAEGAAFRSFPPSMVRRLHGRTFVTSADGGPAVHAAFPPGTWEAVGWVAATQGDTYLARVPTTGDSTTMGIDWSVYLVTTHTTTPSTWFVSAPDSGYSIDNIAPGVPQQFAASYAGGDVELTWDPAPEADFQYFRLYRSTDPGFVPGPATLVHQTAGTSWQDSPAQPGAVFYRLTALDHAGNESQPAFSGPVSAVGTAPGAPRAFALRPASPNPFRAVTRIAFDLPRPAAVTLDVFDVSGRLVRTLARGTYVAGPHELTWDGTDGGGRTVAAGVYLYRLRTAGFESTSAVVVTR
jgi:hypothetical protein